MNAKTEVKHMPTPIYNCKGNHGAMCSCMQNDLDAAGWSENAIKPIIRAVNSHDALFTLLKDVGTWLEKNLSLGKIDAGTANRDGDLVSQIRAAIAKASEGK